MSKGPTGITAKARGVLYKVSVIGHETVRMVIYTIRFTIWSVSLIRKEKVGLKNTMVLLSFEPSDGQKKWP